MSNLVIASGKFLKKGDIIVDSWTSKEEQFEESTIFEVIENKDKILMYFNIFLNWL